MIAGRIGLVVLAAVAFVLAVIVGIDLARDRTPPSRALVPGLATDTIARLAWQRAGEPRIVVTRAGDRWRWQEPIAGIPVNAAAIDGVLAAVRGGRWHRRADRDQAGELRATLTVTAGTRSVDIGVGAPLAGSGQTWLAIGDRAYLVDDWVASALAPAPLALRETRPLRDAATADRIVVEQVGGATLRLEGARMIKPRELWVAPAHVAELARALAELELVAGGQPQGGARLVISVDGPPLATLEIHARGCSDGQVAIAGTAGPGCVERARVDAIERAVARLAGPAAEIVEPRLVPFEPIAITVPGGGLLDLQKRPRIGDRDADPAVVAELLAVLRAPLPIAPEVSPATAPVSTLIATDRAGGKLELELLPRNRVRRKGEPVAFAAGEGAWQILAREAAAYRDPTLWVEDPSTIRSISITTPVVRETTTYRRGAVLGEWSQTGPGQDDDATVSALAELLARPQVSPRPRSAGLLDKVVREHTVTFETAPPVGPPVTRTLEVSVDSCAALIDRDKLGLDKRLCAAIRRLVD